MIDTIEEKIYNAMNPDLYNMGVYYTGTHIDAESPYIVMPDDAKNLVANELKDFYGFKNIEWVPSRIVKQGVVTKATILRDEMRGRYNGKTAYVYAIMYTPPVLPKPAISSLGEDGISISAPYMDLSNVLEDDSTTDTYRNLLIRWKSSDSTISENEIAEVLATIENALRNHKKYEPAPYAKPMFVMAVQ